MLLTDKTFFLTLFLSVLAFSLLAVLSVLAFDCLFSVFFKVGVEKADFLILFLLRAERGANARAEGRQANETNEASGRNLK